MPRRKPLQFALKVEAGVSHRFQEFRRCDRLQDGKPGRAHQGIAAKSAALVAMFETAGLLRRQQRGERNAAAYAFAERHNVGGDTRVLIVEELAGTADAGLDFIKDQQQTMCRGQFAQVPQELIRCWQDAGFPLDRLQHHGNGLVVDLPFNRIQIVQPRLGKPRHLRFEQGLEGLLARRRHRRQRPTVETAIKRDDLVGAVSITCAVFARQLDRTLVGLRAGIGKEDAIEAALVDQCLGQLQAYIVEISRTRRNQLHCLCRQRFGHRRRRMSEAIDGPSLDKSR